MEKEKTSKDKRKTNYAANEEPQNLQNYAEHEINF